MALKEKISLSNEVFVTNNESAERNGELFTTPKDLIEAGGNGEISEQNGESCSKATISGDSAVGVGFIQQNGECSSKDNQENENEEEEQEMEIDNGGVEEKSKDCASDEDTEMPSILIANVLEEEDGQDESTKSNSLGEEYGNAILDVEEEEEKNDQLNKLKDVEEDDGTGEEAMLILDAHAAGDEGEKNGGKAKTNDSDEDNDGPMMIRIRDIGSLREQEEDNSSDDDVVEISPVPIVHAPFVRMGESSDVTIPLSMECGEDSASPHSTMGSRKKKQNAIVLRKKLIQLSNMLSQLQKKGQSGINVKDYDKPKLQAPAVTTTSSSIPYSRNSFIRVQAPSSKVTMASSNVVRVNSSQMNSPFNCIVTSRGLQQVQSTNTSASSIRSISSTRPSMSTRPHILSSSSLQQPYRIPNLTQSSTSGTHQVVFDPRTGLLLCPTQTAVTSQANNSNTFRAIQATPQLLAAINSARVSRPGLTNGISTISQSTTSTVRPPYSATSYPRPTINTTFPITGASRTTTPVSIVPVRQITRTTTPRGGVPSGSNSARAAVTQNKTPYPPIAPKNVLITPLQSSAVTAGRTNTLPQQPRQVFGPAATAAPVSASFSRKSSDANKPKDPSRVTAGTQQTISPVDPKEKAQSAKTFPSLVVTVKPYLQEKLSKAQSTAVRTELDQKVKTILMQSPVKFIEWLIQKGLLKMDNKCYVHNTLYKLGMYSDSDKYPYSGGYVFTVDCCPDKQLPVFQGSIFEASVYPPGTTMKLMYHWACQTPAPNVLQWVKVTSYYLKNFYTLLRSACVASLHENASVMGGKGKYIEVGVVTLGTLAGATTVSAKQTKIEILGVFDPGAKFIRMRLLNITPGLNAEMAKREKVEQILTPLSSWVNRESVLLIDSSLDKAAVERLGFRNVSQSKVTVGVKTTIPTNVNVMNYLKNIVPRMFQNTLCVLSRSLIQQFLDELSWRELWGPHPLKTFETMMSHLVHMTKADLGELLIPRLNKISLNPFAEWSYSNKKTLVPSGIECLPDSIRSQPLSELVASAVGIDSSISSLVSNYLGSSKPTNNVPTNSSTSVKVYNNAKRKAEDDAIGMDLQKVLLESPKTHTLQAFYYVYCPSPMESYKVEFPSHLKCPLCSKSLKTNIEAMVHLISHVLSSGRLTPSPYSCRYCLKELQSQVLLDQHSNSVHKKLDEINICRICNDKYPSSSALILHMWRRHVNCEAPYRCEVCDYRSSFHHNVIDHFHKEHNATDTVQCPICLRTFPARSITCLKNVVSHLQYHVLRKGKKCQDCCLVFQSDADYRAHLLNDGAHESRRNKNFVQFPVDDNPIRMPKPPSVTKDLNIPPPAKKTKTGKSPAAPNLQTLNTSFAVPLNPSDRYMFTPMNLNISDVELFAGMECWECSKPIRLPGHYRGTMKCSRCRFETCCSFTIQKHIKCHDVENIKNKTVLRTKLALDRELDLMSDALECTGCYFVSGSTRRFARHLLQTGHKACFPKSKEEETK